MQRLIFANQLRGLAALLVVLSHWGGVYWGMLEAVSQYSASPQPQTPAPLLYHWISFNPEFGIGPLGVSIFFLISGLVIPFSLAKLNPREFLFARAMRILPSYWFAWLFLLGTLLLASQAWQRPFPWPTWVLFSNAILLQDIFQHPSIDMVNWTLSIEIKFYLIAALCHQAFLRAKLWPLLSLALACLLLNVGYQSWITHWPGGFALLTGLSQAAVFIPFMLIGSVVHFYLAGKMSLTQTVLCSFVLCAIFLLGWQQGPLRAQFPVVPKIYLTGLALFLLAVYFRAYFMPSQLLDRLADLSYPLYLVHAIPGYVLCTWLLHWQTPYPVILAVQFVSLLTLAWLIHLGLEKPGIRLSQRLILHWRQQPAPRG